MSVRPLLFTALCLAALSGCGSESPQKSSNTNIEIALNWFPEAEHGGYYAAEVHDLFRQESLSVKILGGGPNAPVVQRVASGQVAFGVCNADDVLNARAGGAPVIALMAPLQINPRCIMTHAESGILRLEDLADVTLAISPRPAFSHFLRHRYPLQGVRIVPYQGSLVEFLNNPRHAQQAYNISEPFLARSQGANPHVLMLSDTGFNPYASVLITSEDFLAKHPKLVADVVRASLAGWKQYLDAPTLTNRHIHKLNPEMSLEVLSFGADLLIDMAKVPEEKAQLGHMSAVRWEQLSQQMMDCGLLKDGSDLEKAYTTRFLE